MSFDQDVATIRGDLKKMDKDADKLKEKVKGGRVATLLDMDIYVKGDYADQILGNYIIKVDGPSNKLQLGTSHNVTLGHRGEGILGGSTSHILGTDWKVVTGMSSTRITGMKHETIVGAKWDELYGPKFEKKASKTTTLGSAPEMRKTDSRFQKFGQRIQQVLGVKMEAQNALHKIRNLQREIGKLEEKIQSLEATVSSIEQHVKTHQAAYDSFKADASGSMGLDCSGAVKYQISSLTLKGHGGASMAQVPYAKIAKGGSYVYCAPGNVVVKGATYHFK